MWNLYMSIIICTFVLSVLITKTGSVHELGVAEGGLPRAWSVRTLHPTLLNNKVPRSKLGDQKRYVAKFILNFTYHLGY
jgi:hypothetical protein